MSRRLLLTLTVVLLAACGGSKTKSKDNVAIPNALEKLTPSVQLQSTWKTSVKSNNKHGQRLSPGLYGDVVYLAGTGGVVRAVDATSGRTIWQKQLSAELSAGASSDGSRVVVGGINGEVIALDAKDGETLWSVAVSSEVLATPTLAQDRVIVRSNDGLVHALSLSDGKTLWKVDRDVPLLTLRGAAQPIVDGEFVYIAMDTGKVLALKLADGAIRWEQAVSVSNGRNELQRISDIDGGIALNGDLFVSGYNGQTAAVNLQTGEPIWSYSAGSVVGLSLADRAVILTDSASNVIALDRRSGAELWKQTKLLNRQLSAPRVLNGNVLVADFEGYVHAINLETGDIVGRTKLSGAVIMPMAGDANAAYALAIDGTLTRLSIK
jgi:outer membrane protein assembly factor BamB